MSSIKTKVILQQTVPQLGLVGDVADVAPGYFRNFLGPRKLAIVASTNSIKQAEHQKKLIEAKKTKEKAKALELKKNIEATGIKLAHSAGAGEKLYGSVTNQEIALALKTAGFGVDRKMIQMASPIKTVGTHTVDIKLHPEVVAQAKVEVTKKVEEKKEKAE